MEGMREVQQLDDTHLRWHADIGGQEKTWDAAITARGREAGAWCGTVQRPRA